MASPSVGRLPPAGGRNARRPTLVEAFPGRHTDAGSIPAASISAVARVLRARAAGFTCALRGGCAAAAPRVSSPFGLRRFFGGWPTANVALSTQIALDTLRSLTPGPVEFGELGPDAVRHHEVALTLESVESLLERG
jgi:hypothetical protein